MSALTLEELSELLTTVDTDELVIPGSCHLMTWDSVKPRYRMNPEALVPWLNALLDEGNKQGRGYLKRVPIDENEAHVDDPEYCCLGLLCEVAIAAGLEMTNTTTIVGRYEITYYDRKTPAYLPTTVAAWAGLRETCPEVTGWVTFSAANDRGTSFETIAKMIWRVYGPDVPETN